MSLFYNYIDSTTKAIVSRWRNDRISSKAMVTLKMLYELYIQNKIHKLVIRVAGVCWNWESGPG